MKTVHPNSIVTYHELNTSERRELILSVYVAHRPQFLTDRQVAEYLGFRDLNSVRPRITEMIQEEILFESLESAKDHITNRTVRKVGINEWKEPQKELWPTL